MARLSVNSVALESVEESGEAPCSESCNNRYDMVRLGGKRIGRSGAVPVRIGVVGRKDLQLIAENRTLERHNEVSFLPLFGRIGQVELTVIVQENNKELASWITRPDAQPYLEIADADVGTIPNRDMSAEASRARARDVQYACIPMHWLNVR